MRLSEELCKKEFAEVLTSPHTTAIDPKFLYMAGPIGTGGTPITINDLDELEETESNKMNIHLKETKKVLEDVYNNGREYIIPHLMAPPGIGKTSIVYDIAKEHGVNVVELVCSQISYTELSGMPMPDKETQTMTIYDNKKLIEMKDGDILFLDEFDKSDDSVRHAVLKLLQERQLMSGRKLADIMIVAASNNTQSVREVDDCIRDRFMYIHIDFEPSEGDDYIEKKYKIPMCLGDRLDVTDSTDRWNALTPRTAEKLIKLCKAMYNNNVDMNDAFSTLLNLHGDSKQPCIDKIIKSIYKIGITVSDMYDKVKKVLYDSKHVSPQRYGDIIGKLEKNKCTPGKWLEIIDKELEDNPAAKNAIRTALAEIEI